MLCWIGASCQDVIKVGIATGQTTKDLVYDSFDCLRVCSSEQIDCLKGRVTMEVGSKVQQMCDWVAVRDGGSVHSTIIPTRSPVTGGFL